MAATPSRPRDAAATRERLLHACERVFRRDGYLGTDSNRLARAAGFAPATFYKHFKDKRAAFLAVHDRMLQEEWNRIDAALAVPGTPMSRAEAVVDVVVDIHRRWRTFRLELMLLARTDTVVRRAYRKARQGQLALMGTLRTRYQAPTRSRDDDAVLLFTLERLADALADEEAAHLDVAAERLRALMVRTLADHLTPGPSTAQA